MSSNLILSTVQRMDFGQLQPFLHSLRRHQYSGKIVFFVSGLSAETSQRLVESGVELVPFEYFSIRMRRPALLLWPLWRKRFSRMSTFEEKAALAKRVFFFMVLRHLLYYELLTQRTERYDRILLTDSRDVFFQKDPFSTAYESGLHAFLEGKGRTINTCSANRQMIVEAFGPEMLGTMGPFEPSCAGVTIGDSDSVIKYLRKMTELAFEVRTMPMVTGLDQGIHNYIVHQGLVPQTHLHANSEGGVLTMGVMEYDEIQRNTDGEVTDAAGQVIPILHQYDRHSEVARRLVAAL